MRTCNLKINNKHQHCHPEEAVTELSNMKKMLKRVQKRSKMRLRECRELKSHLATMHDVSENQETKIKKQKKDIEVMDDTISKLRKNESEVCNICFESVPPGAENKTECGHTFHCGCLLKWLKKNNTCPCCRVPLYDKPTLTDDFDRVIGDAMVDLYSQSIINDPEMSGLVEFGNYLIEGLIPENDAEMPNVSSITEYINEAYTEDEAVADSDDEEDVVWVRLIGSEHDSGDFFVNQITGDIVNSEEELPDGAVLLSDLSEEVAVIFDSEHVSPIVVGPISV
jgi:hypothetical protein